MSSSLERLARNQALFREVNERVLEVAGADGRVRFVCECSHTGCDATVELGEAQYEAVRSEGTWFVVAAGHDLPEIERVVAKHDGYLVVEKTVAAEVAEATDPRK